MAPRNKAYESAGWLNGAGFTVQLALNVDESAEKAKIEATLYRLEREREE